MRSPLHGSSLVAGSYPTPILHLFSEDVRKAMRGMATRTPGEVVSFSEKELVPRALGALHGSALRSL